MASNVILVRHGETEWTRVNRHTGSTDLPLFEIGLRQAKAVGRYLNGCKFTLLLVSPLRRALDTAELAGWGDSAQICEDLREWDYGKFEGLTTDEIRRFNPQWTIWSHPCPGGEPPERVIKRVDRVIDLTRTASGNVLLFGHGHNLRILAARWCALPGTFGRYLDLSTGSVSELSHDRDDPIIESWNHAALAPHGLEFARTLL